MLTRRTALASGALAALATPLPALAQGRKDSVTLALVLEPPGLDPTAGAASSIAEVTLYNIYETLTKINPDGSVSPLLAESWEVSSDLKTYTFRLRKDVKFHNGEPFNAAAVKFSFDRAAADKSTNKDKRTFANLSTKVADEHTVVLTNQEKAQIRVKWVDELPAPYANACATTQNTLKSSGVEYDFAIIRFRRENRCMGKNKSDADLLLMHELGHALGFAKHAKEDDVMSTHDPVWGKNEVNLLTLQHFLTGLYSLSPGQKIPGNTRMPEPAARMNVYHAPMEEKGPVYAVTPTERLPESRPLASTPQYRKIEKRLPDGTLTVEFSPLEPTSVNTNSSGAPILTPPGEIMTPRKATVSSGMDRIIEINSKTMKKGLSRPMETIEPGR